MQDLARAGLVFAENNELPDLCWNWLWFRRYILSVPERCTTEMRRCHLAAEDPAVPERMGVQEVSIEMRTQDSVGTVHQIFVEKIE